MRTVAEINDKLSQQQATVWTIDHLKQQVGELGIDAVARQVDVVTTGTFEPFESAGAVLNLGHTDPPINISQCWLDDVPAYTGLGAVDLYIGAAQVAADPDVEQGGGHVIANCIAGKPIRLRAVGHVTDCYPRATLDTTIQQDSINQFYLFNPRGLHQNFIVGVNAGSRLLHTYLGPLQPQLGNAVYANSGAISPLLNDPQLRLIGVGTRIFLGGGIGYVVGEGTQHFPLQKRLANQTPIGPAVTLALQGDAKQMNPRWVRGCYFRNYGASLMLGVGVALPILDAEVVARCAVPDSEIVAPIIDFSIPRRVRPTFGLVNYAQLKSGQITIEGRSVRVAPLASLYLSQQVALELKQWLNQGKFLLTEPVAPIPQERVFLPQDTWRSPLSLD
ncbi:MAG: homocysteine biosynthesis protein [Cyanobacteria bacterium P01_H01_bin.121]